MTTCVATNEITIAFKIKIAIASKIATSVVLTAMLLPTVKIAKAKPTNLINLAKSDVSYHLTFVSDHDATNTR